MTTYDMMLSGHGLKTAAKNSSSASKSVVRRPQTSSKLQFPDKFLPCFPLGCPQKLQTKQFFNILCKENIDAYAGKKVFLARNAMFTVWVLNPAMYTSNAILGEKTLESHLNRCQFCYFLRYFTCLLSYESSRLLYKYCISRAQPLHSQSHSPPFTSTQSHIVQKRAEFAFSHLAVWCSPFCTILSVNNRSGVKKVRHSLAKIVWCSLAFNRTFSDSSYEFLVSVVYNMLERSHV